MTTSARTSGSSKELLVPAIADVMRSILDQGASKPSLNTVSEPAS
jgi:hypothetical protein